jgi:hypothetical protein
MTRRVTLDEFFMKNANKLNRAAQKSKRPEQAIDSYRPSASFPEPQEPKCSARCRGQQPAAPHLSERNISRTYITFPQLRFEGGTAYVVYNSAILVSFTTLKKERVPIKKKTKKTTEKEHSAVAIQKELFQKSTRGDTLTTKKAGKHIIRTQFAGAAPVTLANSAA